MKTQTDAKPWDFSQALELVNNLSWKDDNVPRRRPSKDRLRTPRTPSPTKSSPKNKVETKDFASSASKDLGDFGKVWQYLGVPLRSQSPFATPSGQLQATEDDRIPSKADYASDGATYVGPAAKQGKTVQWQDDTSAGEQGADSADGALETSCLTKTQRKKLRRKERKDKERTEAIKNATVSESEAESVHKRTPARKASAHVQLSEPVKRHPSQPTSRYGSSTPANIKEPPNDAIKEAKDAVQAATHAIKAVKNDQNSGNSRVSKQAPVTPTPKTVSDGKMQHSQPQQLPATAPSISWFDDQTGQPTKMWAVANPKQTNVTRFLPATVQPPSNNVDQLNKNFLQPLPRVAPAVPGTMKSSRPVIEPKVVRSGEDRHWALLMKILHDFWEDRKHMISPANLTTHNNHPNGIHVFVDASNIFIGFNDQLKRSRGISLHQHVPEVHLSFDALALLMERRRPVARRVLGGSNPRLPAFDKAEAVGYELNILEKVFKARELTERQKHFKAIDAGTVRRGTKAPPANNVAIFGNDTMGTSPPQVSGYLSGGGGNGGGSEKTAPEYAKAKMIEQGVDEILHMKMMQSLLDYEIPSTMVLATGDAAAAEYSDGFMATVERALKKGWKVELVSWSKNINSLYRRRQWTETWGGKFRIIELDNYAEELLDM